MPGNLVKIRYGKVKVKVQVKVMVYNKSYKSSIG